MKLFQKLLLAPAALGLMAPVAASAADLNVAGVRQYTTSEEQVTSITQFSDVKPTDWAYQALSNLIERYGCVAGYPNGTFKGGQAMTRWEAAALLNACLDRITEVTDELKRLMKEFEKELAVLKGRVDSLEAKVGELEATQFSTTTKLKGIATFVLGANAFSGTNTNTNSVNNNIRRAIGGANPFLPPTTGAGIANYAAVPAGGLPIANTTQANATNFGASTFNYDLRLNFDTSFTGKDLLRTTLRAGNFGGANGTAYANGLSTLETAFEQAVAPGVAADNVIGVNRLFYNFPVGDELSFTAGPVVRVDDAGMLGLWPSAYPADTVLDFFTYAGAPGAYNLNALGGGAGVVFSPKGVKGLTISQNVASGIQGQGGTSVGNPNNGGVWTQGAPTAAVTQVGYAGSNTPLIGGAYGLAFAYTYSQNMPLASGTPLAQSLSGAPAGNGITGNSSGNNYGLSGYWKPNKSGLVPSISWGFGGGSYSSSYSVLGGVGRNSTAAVSGITTASWYTGLQWDDAFIKGNALGMAVGQAPFVTQLGSGAAGSPRSNLAAQGYSNGANDSNYLWEWWYKFQVTDNISVTPALYYISGYDGQYGRVNNATAGQGASDNLFGGLIKTTFKF